VGRQCDFLPIRIAFGALFSTVFRNAPSILFMTAFSIPFITTFSIAFRIVFTAIRDPVGTRIELSVGHPVEPDNHWSNQEPLWPPANLHACPSSPPGSSC
jgi:hypothetical protein